MLSNDCMQCKTKVGRRSRAVSCERCCDWYHVACVGLKDVSARTLGHNNLVFMCDQCLDMMREEWRTEDSQGHEDEEDEEEEVSAGVEARSTPGEVEQPRREEGEGGQDHTYTRSVGEEEQVREGGDEQVRGGGEEQVREGGGEEQVREVAESREEAVVVGALPTGEVRGTPGTAAAREEGDAEQVQPGGGRETAAEEEAVQDQPRRGVSYAAAAAVAVDASQEARPEQSPPTWMGVGKHTWQKVCDGAKLRHNKQGKLRQRLWIFGDSILKGVGREIHFLSAGYYRIMDRTEGGSRIGRIRDVVEEHLREMQPEDLVVVQGGGNGLLEVGENRTLAILKDIVRLVRKKVGNRVLVMCVPPRRREGEEYDRKRVKLNKECVINLEKWRCDGLQLYEGANWKAAGARDGVHLSEVGKVWTGWNVVEWAQHKTTRRRE